MNREKIVKRDNDFVMHTYNRAPLVLEHGRGMLVYDADGSEYLDFTSGIGVNSLGYCDPDWVAAVEKQLYRLQHTSNLYYTSPCSKAAKKLCKLTDLSKVFFGNSGAEANEGAIKAARKYSYDHYGDGRDTVITLENSFHGRTLATLTATGQDVFHQYFGPFNGDFKYVPANDIEALKSAIDDTVCAVMFEPVQGEGGVKALDVDYVHQMVELCRSKDILLIADEVQCGVGRTGTFLACEHYAFTPDIVSLAKGLGGGLPIGAVVTTDAVAQCMTPGTHGSTFGGNPVVCAGACAVLDRVGDPDFLAHVTEMSRLLRGKLAALPHVKAVTGLGLMIGLEFEDGISAGDVLAACREKGLMVLTAKTLLRLLPPLIVGEAEIDCAIAILKQVLGELSPAGSKADELQVSAKAAQAQASMEKVIEEIDAADAD